MLPSTLARRGLAPIQLLPLLLIACSSGGGQPSQSTPNILFVIMDDVGIDQMQVFGYGGATPPSMPNIDQIAHEGVRFHNTWAMPACTTSRAVIFDGRFPLRTNVLGALGPDDLANSMVSPYEMTVPKLLAERGYASAIFGKFHLALQGHDPAGYAMPSSLGFNYFAGWLDETGDPSSIDTTAGGVADKGTWSCGFVRGTSGGGFDSGACYFADATCHALSSVGAVPPGRACLDEGGIFDPDTSCQTPPPDYLNFQTYNSHYVSPLDYDYGDGSTEQVPPTDPRARRFRTAFAVDAAIDWITSRPAGHPWMATVSFSAAHTPVVQPPPDELSSVTPEDSNLDCADPSDQRVLTNQMIESLDFQVGRLLVATGIAQRGSNGALIYGPNRTNTLIVIVGDNGSLGSTVKEPFDGSRSKGTAYQTGVWVPLIVSAPMVVKPDRDVNHMVNIADIYELFGEVAGLDVHQVVPRPIDSAALLPYLVSPSQQSIRNWNYTEAGPNLQPNGAINGPCTIANTCTQIPVTKGVCEDNNGTWWGAGANPEMGLPPEGLKYCCEVNQFLGSATYSIQPLSSVGIRNDLYKIVKNTSELYGSQDNPCYDETDTEFYQINEDVPVPRLDRAENELDPNTLTPDQQKNFDELSEQLAAIVASVPYCPGDGNIDFVVDQKDLDDWRFYNQSTGLSSVYDLNIDGLTNDADESIIEDHLGLQCHTD